MLIIAGHLEVSPTERDDDGEGCVTIVEAARAAPGCLDFSITADSVDPARIRVYERRESVEELLAVRGSGPSDGQRAGVIDADVKRHGISAVGEP